MLCIEMESMPRDERKKEKRHRKEAICLQALVPPVCLSICRCMPFPFCDDGVVVGVRSIHSFQHKKIFLVLSSDYFVRISEQSCRVMSEEHSDLHPVPRLCHPPSNWCI